MKKFTASSGHSLRVRGAAHYIDEVDEARRVTNKVAEYLKMLGCSVNVFHDDVSRSQRENINNIVRYHNRTDRELDVSVHFNAFVPTTGARGVEVLYVSEYIKAETVSGAIAEASGLFNRRAKKRTNLGFLNGTSKPAILIEVCFVDSQEDVRLYKQNFDKICRAIAEALAGKKLPAQTSSAATETPGSFRIYTGAFSDDEAAAAASVLLKKETGYHAFHKENRVWTGTFGTLEDARVGRTTINDKIGFNPTIRNMETGKDVI